MPYIDTYFYNNVDIDPSPGETYQQFSGRVMTALRLLDGDKCQTDDQRQAVIDQAWAGYIFENATQITVTLTKEVDPNSVYNSGWLDWQVAEIHSAMMPTVTYSSVEKARAGAGDRFKISKSVEEKQLVFGWANVAKNADGSYPVDWDMDVTDPAELENAAYTFVLKYRATGEMHEGEVKGHLVESVMLTKEKQDAMGIPDGVVPEAWWVGFYIPDKDVFAKVKSGEYEMFSVQGDALRVPTGQ